MIKKIVVGSVVLALAGVVALGAISALAGGGPVGHVAGVTRGDDDNVRAVGEAGDAEGQVTAQPEEGELGQGAEDVAQAIAEGFAESQDASGSPICTKDEVVSLHEQGTGFGAIFKLCALASAQGMSVQQLLDQIGFSEGEHDFAFGKMRNELSDEERAALEAGPRNLGELVSSHTREGGAEGEASAASTSEASHGEGHGPPEFAQAHGRK